MGVPKTVLIHLTTFLFLVLSKTTEGFFFDTYETGRYSLTDAYETGRYSLTDNMFIREEKIQMIYQDWHEQGGRLQCANLSLGSWLDPTTNLGLYAPH